MRVAVVRGGGLKANELQSFEPLRGEHALRAYGPLRDRGVRAEGCLDVRHLPTPEDLTHPLPRALAFPLRYGLSRAGWNGRMKGLRTVLGGCDVAHAKGVTRGSTWQCLAAKREHPDLRVVVTVAQNIPYQRPSRLGLSAGNERKRRAVLGEADAFVAVTERARLALEIEGVESERVRVIPYGLDLDRFSPRDPSGSAGTGTDSPTEGLDLLFAGQAGWGKGIEFLLLGLARAAEVTGDRSPGIRLHVLEDPDESSRARRIVRLQGLEGRVFFHGRVAYRRMPEVYARADALVVPSVPRPVWQEQFGFVIAEAMACGVPVVGSRCGSIPEVVGDAGLLVQAADVRELAEAIVRLWKKPELRSRLSRLGRRRAEEGWDQKETARRYEALYRALR